MNMTQWLRGILLMPHSEYRPRLVEPILKGIAHPHTALTPEELARVRADLELAEPKACTFRFVNPSTNAHTVPCGAPAVIERLFACGYTAYACAEHVSMPLPQSECRGCGLQYDGLDHLVADLPL